jgi:hypothetical protein
MRPWQCSLQNKLRWGILPGFGGEIIIRSDQVHDRKFSFNARLTNVGHFTLTDLQAIVERLTNGNLLQNADGGPKRKGAVITVPEENDFSDAVLNSGELVDVTFVICLKEAKPFSFLVNVLGE